MICWNNELVGIDYQVFDGKLNHNDVSNDFLKKDNSKITRVISLTTGDKLKFRGRMIQGTHAQTSAHSFRVTIKKLPQET